MTGIVSILCWIVSLLRQFNCFDLSPAWNGTSLFHFKNPKEGRIHLHNQIPPKTFSKKMLLMVGTFKVKSYEKSLFKFKYVDLFVSTQSHSQVTQRKENNYLYIFVGTKQIWAIVLPVPLTLIFWRHWNCHWHDW